MKPLRLFKNVSLPILRFETKLKLLLSERGHGENQTNNPKS